MAPRLIVRKRSVGTGWKTAERAAIMGRDTVPPRFRLDVAMRFDLDLISEHVRALPVPRRAGTERERQAADFMADQFERLGLQVERWDVAASRFKEVVAVPLGWLIVGCLMTAQTVLALRSAPMTTRVLLETAAVGIIALTALGALPAGRRWWPRAHSQVVWGVKAASSAVTTRLVVLAQLDTPAPRWPERTRDLMGTLILAIVFVLGDLNTFAFLHMSRLTQLVLVAGLWLALLIRMCERLDARGAVKVSDSRPALAAILELARTMPASVFERVDVRFTAVGAASMGAAGMRSLAELAHSRWEAKPTLALFLLVPETSRRLLVFGRGDGLRVALEAAKGLWIPHRVVRAGQLAAEHRGAELERAGFAYAAIVGEEFAARARQSVASKPKGEPAPTVPLATAVQLATEIALRWARRTEVAPQREATLRGEETAPREEPPQGERDDKSSQNPG